MERQSPRPLYQTPTQGMFQAWRAEQAFKKSLKNPLTNRSTCGTMNTSNERGTNKMTADARPPP